MNTRIFVKAISSIVIATAALAAYASASEATIKPLRTDLNRPATIVTTAVAKPAAHIACNGCKNESTVVTTQDSKLRTKSLAVTNHKCASCQTTSTYVGSKANGEVLTKHSCLAVASGNCCN
jgi:hypothetical protein